MPLPLTSIDKWFISFPSTLKACNHCFLFVCLFVFAAVEQLAPLNSPDAGEEGFHQTEWRCRRRCRAPSRFIRLDDETWFPPSSHPSTPPLLSLKITRCKVKGKQSVCVWESERARERLVTTFFVIWQRLWIIRYQRNDTAVSASAIYAQLAALRCYFFFFPRSTHSRTILTQKSHCFL